MVSDGQVLVTVEKLGGLPDISAIVRTRFWDLPSGELHQEIFDPHGYEDIYVFPDGTYYAILRGTCPNETGKACGVEVWSVSANKQVLDLDLEYIARAAFSADNRWLALSTREGVQLWNLVMGELVHTLPNFISDRLQFSHDGKLLAGCQLMGDKVLVWQVETGEKLATLASEAYAPIFFLSTVAFSPDDSELAVIFNGVVEYWSTSDWSEGPAWIWNPTSVINKITFSPDDRLAATGAEDGSITLANAATGEVLASLAGHEYYVTDLAFTADGKLLISIALDGTLRFWGIAEE